MKFKVLVFPSVKRTQEPPYITDGCVWIGQCLEKDLAAQGATAQEALYQLERMMVARELLAEELSLEPWDFPAAPDEYHTRFEKAGIHLNYASEWDPSGIREVRLG